MKIKIYFGVYVDYCCRAPLITTYYALKNILSAELLFLTNENVRIMLTVPSGQKVLQWKCLEPPQDFRAVKIQIRVFVKGVDNLPFESVISS